MTDITAALLAAGLPADDVAALAAGLRRACEANDDDARGHERDELWETAHGTLARAREHHDAAAGLRSQSERWRWLIRTLDLPAARRQVFCLPL